SDIDCGGTCMQCSTGQKCVKNNDCLSQSCAGGSCACPMGMKIVPKIGGGSYCIDGTEVTYTQYLVFYHANPVIMGLPVACNNHVYTPSGAWPPGPTQLNNPVAYVDWCDAVAYCTYAGKHLCGKISGGSNDDPNSDPMVYASATQSEWYNAC